MNSKPLVSVIIPNYNHARYLDQRISTVLNQTYQNFEVIILDDCSTDNSLEIINRYKSDSHVSRVVVNNQNIGSPFKQWDKGISLAKGELVWIAESDDWAELNFLENLVPFFENGDDVTLAFSSYVMAYDNGIYLKEKVRKTQSYDGRRFVSHWMCLYNVVKNASGVLFRKAAYDMVSKEYLTFKAAGDYLLWVQIAELGKVVYCPKNLTFFRRHDGNVTVRCYSQGISSLESNRVFDYIESRYRLSWITMRMRFICFKASCSQWKYDDEAIKQKVFMELGLDSEESVLIGKLFFKLFLILQRHLGLLI